MILKIQRLLKMVDGLNFKDFVAFLSAFSAKASSDHKITRKISFTHSMSIYLFLLVSIQKTCFRIVFLLAVIFKLYDSDGNGKVSFNDVLEVFHDLSGSFMSNEQREVILTQTTLNHALIIIDDDDEDDDERSLDTICCRKFWSNSWKNRVTPENPV